MIFENLTHICPCFLGRASAMDFPQLLTRLPDDLHARLDRMQELIDQATWGYFSDK
jgi:hypothetical protein